MGEAGRLRARCGGSHPSSGGRHLHHLSRNNYVQLLFAAAAALAVDACSGTVGVGDDDGSAGRGGEGGGNNAGGSNASCRLEAPMRRLTKNQYANTLQVVFEGKVTASSGFPNAELGSSRTGFSTEPDANVVTKLGAENVLDAAEEVALQVVTHIGELVPCASAANEDCAVKFIDKFGTRLYRRPLTNAERATLVGVFKKAEGAESWKDGIALVTAAMLQSPQFLYISEQGKPTAEEDVVQLSDYELASRLSFLFWDASPDQQLLDAAAAGKLSRSQDLRAQAERLLDDERAKRTVSRFVKEWLAVNTINAADRVGLTDKLAAAQTREFELFVNKAFLGEGTLKEFLTSRDTFVDKAAASSYGLDAAGFSEGDFKAVSLDKDERAGILTLPAVLTSKAHPDEPAYVFRGTFVLNKLMCIDFALPPADAAQMLPAFPANPTQRQKSALISEQPKCGGCHRMIDPIGLSFEAFDQLGRVRDTLPTGQAVNTSGEVVGVSEELDGKFDSPRKLAERMAESAEVHSCVARQAFRFAFSKLDGEGDTCAVEGMVAQFRKQDLSLRELLVGMTQLEGFRFRRLETVQ